MASGAFGDSSSDLSVRSRCKWSENSKVYTRRFRRKVQENSTSKDLPPAAEAPSTAPASTGATEVSTTTVAAPTTAEAPSTEAPTLFPAEVSPAISKDDAASPATTTAGCHAAGHIGNSNDEDINNSEQVYLRTPADEEQQQHPEQTLSKDESLSHTRDGENDGSQDVIGQNATELSVPSDNNEQEKGRGSLQLPGGEEEHGGKELSTQHERNKLPDGEEASRPLASTHERDSGQEALQPPPLPSGHELQDDGETQPNRNETGNVNGMVKPLVITRVDDRVRFNLSEATPKNDIRELREKLEEELSQVRILVKQLEAKEIQLTSYNASADDNTVNVIGSNNFSAFGGNIGGFSQSQPQYFGNGGVERRPLLRVNSEMGSAGLQETRPLSMGLARVNSDVGAVRRSEPRPYNRQLSVAVMENNHGVGEFVEKEKRTPKANQYYRNSEFLLGKDRLPPESKRQKTSNGRKHGGESDHSFGFGFGYDKNRNQVFRSCSSLLQRLMKHKHGWVFNEPVDAKALGLHDYHDIIKRPMDLGTIKTRLSQNWYKSPREFAEDVRLVFRNAMTYNPKGQDVHIMAEQLSNIFEERWAVIETEYNPYWKYQMYQDAGLPTPTSRKAPPQPMFNPVPAPLSRGPVAGHIYPGPVPAYISPAPQMRTLDRSESMTTPMADPRIQRRTPAPKKPKAKDPNKRDMTYEEKQKLSTHLQNLPSEKLDAIVQIIKKRNTTLSQHDDEIEVDIDSVDAETLWELDRFVMNYKKSLSKNKRKAEIAQARARANQAVPSMSTTPAAVDFQKESGAGGVAESNALSPATQGEKPVDNASRSSSSSSSSSDSGSSSSDSDSDSSSADGSDAEHSPRT